LLQVPRHFHPRYLLHNSSGKCFVQKWQNIEWVKFFILQSNDFHIILIEKLFSSRFSSLYATENKVTNSLNFWQASCSCIKNLSSTKIYKKKTSTWILWHDDMNFYFLQHSSSKSAWNATFCYLSCTLWPLIKLFIKRVHFTWQFTMIWLTVGWSELKNHHFISSSVYDGCDNKA
jgi:hypothetical protein